MVPNDLAGIVVGLCWVLVCLAATLVLWPWEATRGRLAARVARVAHVALASLAGVVERTSVPAVVALAMVVRLVPTLILDHGAGFDVASYALVGHAVLSGHSPYVTPATDGRYPYLPPQMYLSAGALWAAQTWHLPFVVLVKLPVALVDGLLAGSIMIGLRRHGWSRGAAARGGLLYAVNPISMLVTSVHGQFDALPLFALIVAWAALAPGRRNAAVWAGLALGAAILIKTWPLLLLPAYLRALPTWRERLTCGVLAIGVPLVGTVAYSTLAHVPLDVIVRVVTGYSGIPASWGFLLLAYVAGLAPASAAHTLGLGLDFLCLLVVAAALMGLRTRAVPTAALATLLAFYVFAGSGSPQYLLWIVPFGLAMAPRPGPWMLWCTVLGAVTLAVLEFLDGFTYYGMTPPTWHGHDALMTVSFVALWLLFCAWGLALLRSRRGDPLLQPAPEGITRTRVPETMDPEGSASSSGTAGILPAMSAATPLADNERVCCHRVPAGSRRSQAESSGSVPFNPPTA